MAFVNGSNLVFSLQALLVMIWAGLGWCARLIFLLMDDGFDITADLWCIADFEAMFGWYASHGVQLVLMSFCRIWSSGYVHCRFLGWIVDVTWTYPDGIMVWLQLSFYLCIDDVGRVKWYTASHVSCWYADDFALACLGLKVAHLVWLLFPLGIGSCDYCIACIYVNSVLNYNVHYKILQFDGMIMFCRSEFVRFVMYGCYNV